jgi:CubicO group peptidase (beta-lactamase class C family)
MATEADSRNRARTQPFFNFTDIPRCSKSGGCLLLLRLMRRGELLFLFVFVVSLPVFGQVKNDKLVQLMEGYVASEHFNGTVLVVKKGAVMLEKGYGYRNIDQQVKNDEHTVYRIARVTEALTSEIIVKLDSKAMLGLEDKVSKYVQGFPLGDKITIKQLLTHTSGVPWYVPDTAVQRNGVCRPMSLFTFCEAYKDKQLSFEPGSRYEYSNADYVLLGFVIEHMSRVHYDDEVADKIFKVCAMRHSGYEFYGLKDEHKATGYYYDGGDKFSAVRVSGDTGILFSVEGMYSTVGDLYKWHQALHQYRLLPEDWQRLAYTPVKNQYALGWYMDKIGGRQYMINSGSYAGFTATVIRDEADDVFVAVLENKMKGGYSNAPIAKALLKSALGMDPAAKEDKKEADKPADKVVKKDWKKTEPTVTMPDPATYKKYVGEFLFNEKYLLVFSVKDNQLIMESAVKNDIPMAPEGGNTFKTGTSDAHVEFVPDKRGVVNKAILHQSGQNFEGKRVK